MTGQDQPSERPLWRRIADFPLVAMILAVALFIAAFAASIAIGKYALPPSSTLGGLAANGAVGVILIVLVYKLAIVRLGERPRDDLPRQRALRDLGAGLVAGFLLFCIVVGVAALLDVYNVVGSGGTTELLRLLIAATIVPAILEEIFFRGILFRWIEDFGGSWAALIVTSAFFGLAHISNPNATWFSSFAIAMEAGLLLGGAYMLTRSLWLPIGLHAAWNFTQGFIFDVPVSGLDQQGLVEARLSGPEILSGGAFGLEASLIAVIVASGAGLLLIYRAARLGQVERPWWVRRRAQRQP
jgi:membrane protease YdiL (CAAX protease family)